MEKFPKTPENQIYRCSYRNTGNTGKTPPEHHHHERNTKTMNNPQHSIVQAVVGGQYGSEGKGAVVAHLARTKHHSPTAIIRVAGPNAGHTAIDANGTAWPLRTIPAGAVIDPLAYLIIAPGSEIELELLDQEITNLEAAGHPIRNRLIIDHSATILEPHHQQTEQDNNITTRIGSTGKGIGAARADRIMRTARTYGERPHGIETSHFIRDLLIGGGRIIIEGTQGYGLGLHTSNYPQTTSSDCRAIDFCAMAGINPWADEIDKFEIVMAVRPYPIRVAGNSGPLNDETTWEQLGLPPELTTVTRKTRRVGHWDGQLVRDAVQANGGHPTVRIALTMADHIWPELANTSGHQHISQFETEIRHRIQQIETEVQAQIRYLGTGPATMLEITR